MQNPGKTPSRLGRTHPPIELRARDGPCIFFPAPQCVCLELSSTLVFNAPCPFECKNIYVIYLSSLQSCILQPFWVIAIIYDSTKMLKLASEMSNRIMGMEKSETELAITSPIASCFYMASVTYFSYSECFCSQVKLPFFKMQRHALTHMHVISSIEVKKRAFS